MKNVPRPNGRIPFVYGFSDLFTPCDEGAEASAPGIKFGATILLSGPPGAGKTTFALSLVRGLMAEVENGQQTIGPTETGGGKKKPAKTIAYFISSEVSSERLQGMYEQYGWFSDSERLGEKNAVHVPEGVFTFHIESKKPDQVNFYCITPQPEVDRPVPSPEELVNGIFNRIAQTLSPSEAPRESAQVYVVLDSITALLKGCANPSEERRLTHEIMHRLRTMLKDQLALTILLAEQDHRTEIAHDASGVVNPTTPSVEDYLADIVFRLYVRALPLGRRSRVLEIVKSQGVNMTLGEHTWQILSEDNYKGVLRCREFQATIKYAYMMAMEPDPRKWIAAALELLASMDPTGEKYYQAKGEAGGAGTTLPPPKTTSAIKLSSRIIPGISSLLPEICENFDSVIHVKKVPAVRLRKQAVRHCLQTLMDVFTLAAKTNEVEKRKQYVLTRKYQQGKKWGGIIIFPRRRLQTDRNRQKIQELKKFNPGEQYPQAVHLCKSLARFSENQKNPGKIGLTYLNQLELDPGSITLVAGPGGVGKTSICKEFMHRPDSADRSFLFAFDASAEETNEEKDEGKEDEGDGPTPLVFTQHQFDLNVLISHISFVIKYLYPERIVFDGLSEWITMFDRLEAARMLESLIGAVKHNGCGQYAPRVLMTYELDEQDDILGPQLQGMSVDNLITIRLVQVYDQIRRILHVVKWRSVVGLDQALHDNNPMELVLRPNGDARRYLLEVTRGSLDYFTNLLGPKGSVKPAKVILHLFHENSHEERWNETTFNELLKQFKATLDIEYSKFNRSEIGGTLASAMADHSAGEHSNLRILSADEWWLGDGNAAKVFKDVHQIAGGPDGVDLSEFWIFETEKAIPRASSANGAAISEASGDFALHAIPGHMDFGMLSLDAARISKAAGTLVIPEGATPREWWQAIVARLPRYWVHQVDENDEDNHWFSLNKRNSPASILQVALDWTGQSDTPREKRLPVFSFDTATRETTVCMFMELCWAFGAGEDFLLPQRVGVEQICCHMALSFLQYMVFEGLMPAGASFDREHAPPETLLSRQFYSTFTRTRFPCAGVLSGQPLIQPGVFAIPFMPTASSEARVLSCLAQDFATRLKHWVDRARLLVRTLEVSARPDLQGNLARLENTIKRITDHARAAAARSGPQPGILEICGRGYAEAAFIIQALLQSDALPPRVPEGMTATRAPDFNDLLESLGWSRFRLALIRGNRTGCFSFAHDDPVGASLEDMRDSRYLPPVRLPPGHSEFKPVPTGYGCSGSWFYGVSRNSRAQTLQKVFLKDLTSLEKSARRAREGAGLPSRKDFFYQHGHESVPGMEYQNWREFLRYNGSRVRRRERVMDPRVNRNHAYTVIHQEVLSCLRFASILRGQSLHGGTFDEDRAQEQMRQRSRAAFKRIVEATQRFVEESGR